MSLFYRRNLPQYILLAIGSLTVIEIFVAIAPLTSLISELQNWTVIMWSFAMALSALMMILRQTTDFRTHIRTQNWPRAALNVQFVFLFLFAWLGATILGSSDETFLTWFSATNYAGAVGVASVLLVYTVAASVRAFTFRSPETIVLIGTMIFMMITLSPLGSVVAPDITSPISQWIFNYPNRLANRGMIIGLSLGSIIMGLRVMSGLERAALGGAIAE
jgi:NADH:ubiquinone oxidoreductase subunit 6 (subunit J)